MAALRALAILLFLSLAGTARARCGDGQLDTAQEECDDGNTSDEDGCGATCEVECTEVGAAATEHTCLHGASGPFANRVSTAPPGSPVQDVDAPHTYFTIALADAGESPSLIGFRPAASGDYAVYLKERYPIRLLDEAGLPSPVFLEHAIDSCSVPDSIRWVRVYRSLKAGARYQLELGAWPGGSMSIALESLGFEVRLYRDADRDGFGARGAPAAHTWCTPPPAYSRGQGDCDDVDPDVHPGAPETCDGRNTDCDAHGDDAEADLCRGAIGGTVCVSRGDESTCGCRDDDDCAPSAACFRSACVARSDPPDAAVVRADGAAPDAPRDDAGAGPPLPLDGGAGNPADAAAPESPPPASDDGMASSGSCRVVFHNSEEIPGIPVALSALALVVALRRRRPTCHTCGVGKGSRDAREASLLDTR